MTVSIDEKSGCCFGVINAIRTAEDYLALHGHLYCLGDIVHNSEEVERLTGLGLQVISYEQFADLHDTVVLIRAHGEPPTIYRIAEENNIRLIDATCPVVLKLQQRIRDFYRNGENRQKQILIFGKNGHAEVVGLMGQADNNVIVISSFDEVDNIDFSRPSMLYSQTTQGLQQYYRLIDMIRNRYRAQGKEHLFEYSDTICRKVSNRAAEIAEFSRNHDAVIFVSGEKSSNGLYLFEICKANNADSFFISKKEQIAGIDFSPYGSVGICGATSTPMWLMEACAKCVER